MAEPVQNQTAEMDNPSSHSQPPSPQTAHSTRASTATLAEGSPSLPATQPQNEPNALPQFLEPNPFAVPPSLFNSAPLRPTRTGFTGAIRAFGNRDAAVAHMAANNPLNQLFPDMQPVTVRREDGSEIHIPATTIFNPPVLPNPIGPGAFDLLEELRREQGPQPPAHLVFTTTTRRVNIPPPLLRPAASDPSQPTTPGINAPGAGLPATSRSGRRLVSSARFRAHTRDQQRQRDLPPTVPDQPPPMVSVPPSPGTIERRTARREARREARRQDREAREQEREVQRAARREERRQRHLEAQRNRDAQQDAHWMAVAEARHPNSPMRQAQYVADHAAMREEGRAEAEGRPRAFDLQFFQMTHLGRLPNAEERAVIVRERERERVLEEARIEAAFTKMILGEAAKKKEAAMLEMKALYVQLAGEREAKERVRWEGRGGGPLERLKARLEESWVVLEGEVHNVHYTHNHTYPADILESVKSHTLASSHAASEAADTAANSLNTPPLTFTDSERKDIKRVLRTVAKRGSEEAELRCLSRDEQGRAMIEVVREGLLAVGVDAEIGEVKSWGAVGLEDAVEVGMRGFRKGMKGVEERVRGVKAVEKREAGAEKKERKESAAEEWARRGRERKMERKSERKMERARRLLTEPRNSDSEPQAGIEELRVRQEDAEFARTIFQQFMATMEGPLEVAGNTGSRRADDSLVQVLICELRAVVRERRVEPPVTIDTAQDLMAVMETARASLGDGEVVRNEGTWGPAARAAMITTLQGFVAETRTRIPVEMSEGALNDRLRELMTSVEAVRTGPADGEALESRMRELMTSVEEAMLGLGGQEGNEALRDGMQVFRDGLQGVERLLAAGREMRERGEEVIETLRNSLLGLRRRMEGARETSEEEEDAGGVDGDAVAAMEVRTAYQHEDGTLHVYVNRSPGSRAEAAAGADENAVAEGAEPVAEVGNGEETDSARRERWRAELRAVVEDPEGPGDGQYERDGAMMGWDGSEEDEEDEEDEEMDDE